MKHYTTYLLCFFSLWLLPTTGLGDDPIAVIVHPSNPLDRMDRQQLRPIFQTSKTSWDHDGGILALNLAESAATRHEFDRAVLGLDPDRVARYWIDRKIRGGARPPKRVPNPQAVKIVVSKKENAIGYVQAHDVDKSVKVVARIVNGKVVAP